MDWAQILVIILAVLFAIFLIVLVALAVAILSVTRQIKAATASAERTIHAIESSVTSFHKVALPLAVTKGILGQLTKKSRKKKKTSTGEQE